MSNEISVSISARLANIKLADQFQPGALTFDQATQGAHSPVVSVTTGEEALDFGDVVTKGWVFGRNLDSANYVVIGPTTESTGVMHPFMRVEAGEPFSFRLDPTAGIGWKWHSSTGTVKVQLHLWED